MSTPAFFQRSELTRALWLFRREFMLVALLSMVANVLMLAPTLYMLQVFDRVMISRSELTLLAMSLITLFLFLVLACSEWLRSRVLVLAGQQFDEILSSRVFNASFASNLQKPGSETGGALGDLVNLRQFLTGQGVFAFFDTPWVPVYIIVLFLLHPILGWAAIGFALIQAVMVWLGHSRAVAPGEAAAKAQSKSSGYLQGKLRNVEAIVPMGMVQNLRDGWLKRHAEALDAQSNAQGINERLQAISKFVRYTQQALTLALGALLVIDGQMSPGAMIAANVLTSRALAPIDSLVGAWRGFISARAAFRRLESLLQANPAEDPQLSRTAPAGQLALRDVTAVALERKEPILKNVSARLQPGQVTVVLGPSGSGKSTMARCMVGTWPYLSGEVLLDERPLSGWSRDELGPYIGYLPQDIELFDGSIADNIARMGKVDSERVIAAAEAAGLHDMILRFPQGYDTPIGEGGGLLSGGQRQRIGLARAIYGQPKLVVLDEPNANLDDVGEAALVRAVQTLKEQGSTVLVISHRPGILAVADRVIVLKEGVVQADGPRDEVMQRLRNASQPAAAPQGSPALA